MSPTYDAIVIGLGGMGSAAAFHLARRGQSVLGLEQFDLLHEMGSSHGLTRIIRLAYHEHPSYVPLLRRAYELWHDLEQRVGERLLITTGSVEGGGVDGSTFRGALEAAQLHQLPHEVLTSAELRDRFPGYRGIPDDVSVVWQPDGGYLLAERTILAHVGEAMRAGASLHFRERVVGWQATEAGVAVTTSAGHYTAGRLVVCAGPWARQLIPQLARLAVPERQVLIWTQALEPELFTADRFPVFVLDVDGESYYGFPIHDVPGFKLGRYHHLREPIDPDDPDRAAGTDDEALLRTFIDRCFPAASGPTLMLKTCIFTNSPDEHFLVGELPSDAGVVVAAGFSGHGYKFCSVIGEILADLVIDGRTGHDIGLFRLDRFG